MNIINIFVLIMVAAILILQLLNVAVSQKAVNIVLCTAVILEVVGNSGWLHL
jgi:hypothetical protein